MFNTIRIIDKNQINTFLNDFKTNRFSLEINNFISQSKNILYGPKLNKKLFKSDLNIYLSNNFENINLGRYWTDSLVYQINKLSYNELIQSIKNNKIPNFINIIDLNGNVSEELIITPNEFPYRIPNPNYSYYLLWNLNSSTGLSIEDVGKIFSKELVNKDYIIWRNPLIFKSVKTIEHYHILYRPNIPKLTLKKLFIFGRHGPREPILFLPKFNNSYWSYTTTDHTKAVYASNLTSLGKLYCKFVGGLLYFNYSDDFDFSKLNPSNTKIFSTNFDRTIQSAMLVLDGMGLSNNYNDINVVDFIGSDTIFTPEQKNEYNNKMKNPQINWDKDLTELNNQIEELTGYKIKTFKDYFELASTLKCYEFHGYQMLDNPESNNKLTEIKPVIYNLATYYYNYVHDNKNDYYSENIYLGKKVLDKILELFETSDYMFSYFSSHDNIIYPLVKSLIFRVLNQDMEIKGLSINKEYFTQNIRSKINYLEYPEFNSTVRFELWIGENNKEIIRVYYNSLMLFEFS